MVASRALVLFAAIASVACQASYRARLHPLDSDGGDLRDAHGRAVILRGANVKIAGVFAGLTNGAPPAESVPAFDSSDVAELRALGFDFVRVPINWSELE